MSEFNPDNLGRAFFRAMEGLALKVVAIIAALIILAFLLGRWGCS